MPEESLGDDLTAATGNGDAASGDEPGKKKSRKRTVAEKLAEEPVGRAPEPDEIELMSFIKADLREALAFLAWDEDSPVTYVKLMCLPTIWAVIFYRIASWAYFKHRALLPIALLFYWLNIMLFGCEISATARIGKGFLIGHTVGVEISSDVEIGERFRVMKGASIGSSGRFMNRDPGMPVIGDDVWMMYMTGIAGKITIGNRVMIGAGAGVMSDIPHGSFVPGNLLTDRYISLNAVLPPWQRPVQAEDGTWSSPNCRTMFGPPKKGFEIPTPD